jgi:hypothetical protein
MRKKREEEEEVEEEEEEEVEMVVEEEVVECSGEGGEEKGKGRQSGEKLVQIQDEDG